MSTDMLSVYVQVFCTLAILSFLYKDNPIYKLVEHWFVGFATGWYIVTEYRDVFLPNLFYPLLWLLTRFSVWGLWLICIAGGLFIPASSIVSAARGARRWRPPRLRSQSVPIYALFFLVTAAVAQLTLGVVRAWFVDGYRIPEGFVSMEPTLFPGDCVLLMKIGDSAAPRRNSVAVIQSPIQPGVTLVRRVVAIGGETLQLHRGEVWVNGASIRVLDGPAELGPLKVPPGEFFVLSDNLAQGSDSRQFGTLSFDAYVGEVGPLILSVTRTWIGLQRNGTWPR